MADLQPTRILAFDFDLCVCDGEGFFELFTQLLDIYEFCQQRRSITDKHTGGLPTASDYRPSGGGRSTPLSLPEDFMEMVERHIRPWHLTPPLLPRRRNCFYSVPVWKMFSELLN